MIDNPHQFRDQLPQEYHLCANVGNVDSIYEHFARL